MVVEALKKLAFEHHYRNVTQPRAEKLHHSLSKHIGQVESLLDIGCGDGVIAKRLGEAAGAKRIEGVDILLRPQRVIDVKLYDGYKLPFPDQSFEAVTIVDVLHHCTEPETVLRETVRVASKMVVIKDHFAFGPISRKILHYMDIAGNARDSVPSPGTYFEPHQWVDMIARSGAQVVALEWPLALHNMPWRAVVRPALHFTAKIVPRVP
jgi:SAM-dependent methyltransferase